MVLEKNSGVAPEFPDIPLCSRIEPNAKVESQKYVSPASTPLTKLAYLWCIWKADFSNVSRLVKRYITPQVDQLTLETSIV